MSTACSAAGLVWAKAASRSAARRSAIRVIPEDWVFAQIVVRTPQSGFGPVKTWEKLRVLERVSNTAFMGFIASMLVLGTLGVGQPAWYMRMNSWKWVNISLVTGALVAALVIVLVRAWAR